MSEHGGEAPFAVGAASVIGSSAKALRVRFGADALATGEAWIPRSVIHDDSEVFDAFNNARGKLVVQRWFARREGWESE